MTLILNEKKYAEDLILGKNDSVKGLRGKVNLITRYNYHVKHLSSSDNYEHTVRWLNKHQDNFCECNYSKFIELSVKSAMKSPFYDIESLKITASEMNIVKSLDNIRQQKILFVLLCFAKFQRIAFGYTNGFVNLSIVELYKHARVSVPAGDRELILYEIAQKGYIRSPQKNDSTGLFITFISELEDSVVLEVDGRTSKELAYLYLSFINDGVGYGKCQRCGCVIKKRKDIIHCKECCEELEEQRENKTIWCIDCGTEVKVSIKDNQTCRCEECQNARNRELKSERNKRYYESHKK